MPAGWAAPTYAISYVRIVFANGRDPVPSGISKWSCRHISKGARTLARELLEMSQEEFSAVFRHSPMKRAKLRGLQRNAQTVLANLDGAAARPNPEFARQDESATI